MTWTLEIDFDWPREAMGFRGRVEDFEALLREVVDPLHRENVVVSGVRLVQSEDE